MQKIYNHQNVEDGIEFKWREKKYFIDHNLDKKPFSILLPPPNVTGKLHLGHALDSYIPDTIIRFKKLSGYDVLWLPGMDHAGIATQSKVESELYKQSKLTRHDLGKEKFLAEVWKWKEIHEKLFRQQWQTLGLALDYSNEAFTLSKEVNEKVIKIFVELYNRGYIYKKNRAVSWDINLQTAISNIEVINKETPQKMYYIKYFFENSSEYLTIATTRVETMLSDVAVVANPKDKRYKNLKKKFLIHPITKKRLPLIFDEYVKIKFGSGLMKLSAHAEADIEIIEKLGLEVIETIDKNGYINAPDYQWHKMERFEAREKMAQFLEENNYLIKAEDSISNVSYSDRSNSVIETLMLPQWFIKMDHFRDLILKNLSSKEKIKFLPNRYKNNLKRWMNNVYDWNISRQLWWGHQIPAWYKDGKMKVQAESPGQGWVQDSDVLDTWFSSGIAAFSFFKWENDDAFFKRYYPSSLMVSGYDLIFFWISRMIFLSLEFTNQRPFKEVFMHGLIRDKDGRKMSKSLNNGIDPIEVVEKYGSDALRWFLITNTAPGMDIRYNQEKIESAWKISNKLYNVALYISSMPDNNLEAKSSKLSEQSKWILNKLSALNKQIQKVFKTYDFSIIGVEIYQFIFTDLSSWYIELIKSLNIKNEAMYVFKKILIMLHPFLPFTSDYLFNKLYNEELLEQSWPKFKRFKDSSEINLLIDAITKIRKYRDDNNISKKEKLYLCLKEKISKKNLNILLSLTNSEYKENKDFLIVLDNNSIFIEISQEQKQNQKQELEKKIAFCQSEITRAQNILSNQSFIAKAPKEKIKLEEDKLQRYKQELQIYLEELKWKY